MAAVLVAHAQAEGLQVLPLTTEVEVSPRSPVHLAARFVNNGNEELEIEPTWLLPQGWRWLVPPAAVRLPAGTEATSIVTLLVPHDWPAGRQDIELLPGFGHPRLSFGVLVRAHRDVHLALLDNPGLVIQEGYDLRFLVSNRGNVDETLRFDLRHDRRFSVQPDALSVEVPAGGSTLVVLRVEPPAELRARTMHTVRLGLVSHDAELSTTASAQTEVLPFALQSVPRHDYDLRLRFLSGMRLDGGAAASWSATPSAAGVQVEGRGTLDPGGAHRLDISASADVVDRSGRFTVRYQTADLRLTAGHHSVRFTPMQSLGSGVGASVVTEHDLGRAGTLGVQAAVLAKGAGMAWGVYTDLQWDGRFAVGLSALKKPGEAPAFGARLQARHDLAARIGAALDVEAVHVLDAATSARASLSLNAGPLNASVRWSQDELGAGPEARRDLSATVTLRVPGSEFDGMHLRSIDYRAWWRHASGPLSSLPRWPQVWGVSASFRSLAAATTTISYTERHSVGPESVRRHELSARLRLPWAAGVDLRSRFRWTHQDSDPSWGRPQVDLGGTLRFSAGGGQGSLGLQLGFGSTSTMPEVETSFHWQAPMRAGFRWSGGVGLRLDPAISARLDWQGELELSRGSTLELGLAGRFRPSGAQSWEAQLALNVPVTVFLAPIGPHGAVEGRVLDESDRPVASAVVRLADQVAITDADGLFRFAAVQPGDHYLVLVPPGSHAGHFIRPGVPWRVITVDAETTGVEFRLLSPAAVSVELVLEAAVIGASPNLEGWVLRVVGPRSSQVVTTGADGFIRLTDLEPGDYRIEVDARQVMPFGYRADPVALELRPGGQAVAQLVLRNAVDERRILDGGTLDLGTQRGD